MHNQFTRKFLQASVGAALLMFGQMPAHSAPGSFDKGFGLEFSSPEDFQHYPKLKVARSLGASERGSHLELVDYLPPVANQGETSSCVGWSTAYYCFSYTIAKERGFTKDEMNNPKYMFSPNFIWDQYNHGNPMTGMHIFDAMDVLAKQGCCSLNEMPWDETGKAQPTDEARDRAIKFKARQTVSLFIGPPTDPADPEKLKTVLWETKRPIVVGITVFDDFGNIPNDPNYVYSPGPGAVSHGGHGVCIVGYDDTKKAFRMVNSWGSDWGDNGFAWLSQDFIAKYAREGWTQKPGGVRTRDLDPVLVLEPAEKPLATDGK
jgi:C1A family cysteine protease